MSHREHGTYVKYVVDKCRCDPCRKANSEYEKARTRRKAYGREPWVDAEPARRHVRRLMAPYPGATNGVGWKRVAQLAGVSTGCVWKLVYGKNGKPSKRIHEDTEAKLMAITPDMAAPRSTVPADETWKLIDELLALGIPKARIGRALTKNPRTQSLQLSRAFVTKAHADRIKALHDAVYRESPEFRWHHCNCADASMRGLVGAA